RRRLAAARDPRRPPGDRFRRVGRGDAPAAGRVGGRSVHSLRRAAMSAWQAIVAAALVGTERTAPRPEPGGGLGDLLQRLDAAEPERHLCQALAAAGPWHSAGRLPSRDPQPLPEPCETDVIETGSVAAAHHLAAM